MRDTTNAETSKEARACCWDNCVCCLTWSWKYRRTWRCYEEGPYALDFFEMYEHWRGYVQYFGLRVCRSCKLILWMNDKWDERLHIIQERSSSQHDFSTSDSSIFYTKISSWTHKTESISGIFLSTPETEAVNPSFFHFLYSTHT